MRKTFGMNKHQKAAHKTREPQVGREEIAELLAMARSGDPEERAVAAQYLCPCHVRTRIEPVWEALYRMLEDSDVRVRRAAWHTLEDGGRPDDPTLDAILERTLHNETDARVRRFAEKVAGPRQDQELTQMWLAGRPAIKKRGKCDFCGQADVIVDFALDTLIPTGDGLSRAALICEPCAQAG
jgi:hypothetical protein